MSLLSLQQLQIALSNDLNKGGLKPRMTVVDNTARKIFTASKDCAVFEFPYKQADINFWSGVKYYGAGNHNRIRIRRTQTETA